MNWIAYYWDLPMTLVCIASLLRSLWLLKSEQLVHRMLKLKQFCSTASPRGALLPLRTARRRWAWVALLGALPSLAFKWHLLPFSSLNGLWCALLIALQLLFVCMVLRLHRETCVQHPRLLGSLSLSLSLGLLL